MTATQFRRMEDNFLPDYDAEAGVTRILLIEDSMSDAALFKRKLNGTSKSFTYEITNVPRMAQAIELLNSRCFDVIVLDLNLLDIEGVTSRHYTRDRPEHSRDRSYGL